MELVKASTRRSTIVWGIAIIAIIAYYTVAAKVLDQDLKVSIKKTQSLVGKNKEDVLSRLGSPTETVAYPAQFKSKVEQLRRSYGAIREQPGAVSVDIYDQNPVCIVVFYDESRTVTHIDVYGS